MRIRRIAGLTVLAAMLCSACITSRPQASPEPDQAIKLEVGCLTINIWDSEPTVTWLEGGKLWTYVPESQACLEETQATSLNWSPDGLRAVLDTELDGIVNVDELEGADELLAASETSRPIWQQPFGTSLLSIQNGAVARTTPTGLADLPLDDQSPIAALASHPDSDHYALVNEAGQIHLLTPEGVSAEIFQLPKNSRVDQIEFSTDGSLLWFLTQTSEGSTVHKLDLSPITVLLEDDEPSGFTVELGDNILTTAPLPKFLEFDPAVEDADFMHEEVATRENISTFALHPGHPSWLAVTEGECANAVTSLLADDLLIEGIDGAAIGWIFGDGIPTLATTTAGASCEPGDLSLNKIILAQSSFDQISVASGVHDAAVRWKHPDPKDPTPDPPFA